jgi:fibrillarin-like pre-rRNA processing protein
MKVKEIFPEVFLVDGKLSVKILIPGFNPFGDSVNKEYIEWNPNRSKLGAAIMKNIKEVPIREGNKILYLGAAHGYTVSKISCIVRSGIIYAVEFSDRCFNELIPVCEKLKKAVPILGDARKPEDYEWIEGVDIVYCDIAQPDQTDIAIRNCRRFLKKNGYLMIAIKTRSIDVTKSPKEISENEIEKVKKAGFRVIDWKNLDPFEKDHSFIVAQM